MNKLSAKLLAEDLGHVNEGSVTTLKSVVNPDASDGHDEMMDLRLCGAGDEAYFEWITEYGDPIGEMFYSVAVSELKDAAVLSSPPFKKVRLVVPAHASSDYGDGPGYAVFGLTRAFLDRVTELVQLREQHRLSEVRIYEHPEDWGPGDVHDDLRLTCAELVVVGNGVWFEDMPKNANYTIQSETVDLATLEQFYAESGHGYAYYNESIEERFKDSVADEEDEEVSA